MRLFILMMEILHYRNVHDDIHCTEMVKAERSVDWCNQLCKFAIGCPCLVTDSSELDDLFW